MSSFKTFLAIAEAGRLNRAAETLNVTQSTVTARLNNLEKELGQTLFHRRKSGAELTSAGFRFERYAQLMLDIWRQARQETALPSIIEATFNLGCHSDLWPELGEVLIGHIRDNEAKVALSAWSGDQSDLDRWLGSGLIDVALCYSPSLRENRREYRLKTEQLVLVSSRPRQLMRWDPEYIYVDSGEEFRKNHAAAYADGETPSVTIGSAVWAKEYLLKNGGSGYLPTRLIRSELASNKLNLVPGAAEFSRNTYLVVNSDAAQAWPWLDSAIASING